MARDQLLTIRTRAGTDKASRLPARLRPKGFTLIEVMVAAMLLVFAMAGVVPFFLSSLNQSASVRYKSAATNIARERMEQIRQLDYREIADAEFLQERFGSSEILRDVLYNVTYAVSVSPYDTGVLKEVTVTVGWTAPPKVAPASMTTMIHQQYVGPRVSRVEIDNTLEDDLGTPFRLLQENYNHTVKCYVAQADWDLVYEDLDEPGMTKRDVYARIALVDHNDNSLHLGDPAEDYKIDSDYLGRTTDPFTGATTEVFFSYPCDSGAIPDGYWEFRATVFNEYDEPGNVWRLRTRVENGAPVAPLGFVGLPQPGDESVDLYWSGGAERDRAYYVIKRSKWDWTGSVWGPWVYVDTAADPEWTNVLDEGDASAALDPWGSASTPNWYQYRIWAVDIANNAGPEAVAECGIPDSSTTTSLVTTTTLPSTTTTIGVQYYTVSIQNTTNKTYDLVIEDDDPATSDIVTSVGRRSTKLIENLPAGNYLITATSCGRPTLYQSFSLPDQAGQIVMTIL